VNLGVGYTLGWWIDNKVETDGAVFELSWKRPLFGGRGWAAMRPTR
jgi:hypothetical protein